MGTNPPNKRKLRFADPQPLNFDTRVGHAIVDGGFRVGDWNNFFVGLEERLKHERDALEEKNRSTCAGTQVLERCAKLGLSLDQAQQLAARGGHDILYVLGLDPQTMCPLRSRRWLWMAAQTCSVSYRSAITPEILLEVLSTGYFAQSVSASVLHFLDEAPIQIVVMSVEEAACESGLDISLIWRNVAQISMALCSTRLVIMD